MISNKVAGFLKQSSAIRAMFEEGAKLKAEFGAENVYDFSIGNPDPAPPQITKDSLKQLVLEDRQDLHSYMNNAGYPDVRAKVAEYLNRQQDAGLGAGHIVMTCGAGGGLNVALKAILNPGEEIIVLSPYFVEYFFYIDNFGGKMVVVDVDKNTFQPDIQAIEKNINAKTKGIIINTPNNPTGVVYKEHVLRELSGMLAEKEKEFGSRIYIISDEPYRDIVYDGVKVPSILDIFENSIIAYSFSKSLSLPGERIGYLAANSKMKDIDIMMDALIFANRVLGFVNAPSLFQRVAADSLGVTVDINIYKERRDMLYNHLTSIGFECVKPEGAFYLFPKSPVKVDELKQKALKYNIILVPGTGFGSPDHFRLAYCVSIETIKNSLQAFSRLADDLGLKA